MSRLTKVKDNLADAEIGCSLANTNLERVEAGVNVYFNCFATKCVDCALSKHLNYKPLRELLYE